MRHERTGAKQEKEKEDERNSVVGRECTLQRGEVGYSLVCHQQQVPVKQRSTNVSSSEPLLFPPRALFLFFLLLPPGSPRTRFSIIDSLTRQDILLSDPRARYKSWRERSQGVLFVDVVSRSINLALGH